MGLNRTLMGGPDRRCRHCSRRRIISKYAGCLEPSPQVARSSRECPSGEGAREGVQNKFGERGRRSVAGYRCIWRPKSKNQSGWIAKGLGLRRGLSTVSNDRGPCLVLVLSRLPCLVCQNVKRCRTCDVAPTLKCRECLLWASNFVLQSADWPRGSCHEEF